MSQGLLYFYLFISFTLIFLSLNCYVMFYLFRRKLKAKRSEAKDFKIGDKDYPSVTTQIAIYNELNVAERVINAVAQMEYPAKKHFIQVVDDSTDETFDLIKSIVANLKEDGVQIEHIHRSVRKGYKAGALAEALEKCNTDYIAIFDADFVPHKDYLIKAMPHFLRGEKIGLVQSRWGHLNRNESLITRVQALGIDGHFAVEQSSRDWNDLYMNFNGTAGIMSVAAIKAAGGWSDDTLTEDMDLSYRMQIAGWNTHYLLDVECPAEVPADMNAFKSQQFRWAKGSMQTALKIVPEVLKDSRAGLFKKYQALMHTTHYIIHPFMLLTALLAWPVAALNGYTADSKSMGWLYISLFICFSAPGLIYITSQKTLFKDWLSNLKCYPALMFIGSGLCISNSKAVWEALSGKVSGFVRTPKKGDKESKHYTVKIPVVPFTEIIAGIYCGFSLSYFLINQQYVAAFFMAVYAIGFLFNGILSLVHNGFLSELKENVLSPYGACLASLILISYFFGQTQTGTQVFTVSYLLIAGLMFLSWRSAKDFTSAHIFLMVVAAVLSRYFMLPVMVSDDVFRYIWEGRVLAAGFDPYILSPDSSALSHLMNQYWDGINHKDWTAIYGPAALLVFSILSKISATPEFFKLFFVACDLAVLFVLYSFLKMKGLQLRSLLFYAINPLIMISFAGEAHLDSLQILLIVSAFWLQDQKKIHFAAVLFGLAVGVKFTSILFLPFLIRRENFYAISVSIGAFLIPAFYLNVAHLSLFDSLLKFGDQMQFNDSVHALFASMFGFSLAKLFCFILLLAFATGYWLTQDNTVRGGMLTMIVFLLLSPTVHPWYLAMIVAMAVIVKSPLVVLWSVSIVFYFQVYERMRNGLGFSHSIYDQLLQYLPVFIFLTYTLYMKVRGRKSQPNLIEGSVSVLIPVLNESANALQIMNDLQRQTYKAKEIITIDGGSNDDTVEKFKTAGAEVLICPEKGRGNQLVCGLEQATGDYVLVLHADKRVGPFTLENIVSAFHNQPELVGGAIGANFDSRRYKYKVIEFLNNLRMAICGISFGDQGQFFKREIVMQNKLLHKIPLMEDVELAIGLQSIGKIVKLQGGLTVSTRRWKKKKVLTNAFQIFYLLTKYLLLRRVRRDVKANTFYESYYSEKPAKA